MKEESEEKIAQANEIESGNPENSEQTQSLQPYDTQREPHTGANGNELASTSLFDDNEAEDLRGRWNSIQTMFVDDPHEAVSEADALVSKVIDHIADKFDARRSVLQTRWSDGDTVTTEDLRLAAQRYRSFFEHLLSI